MYYSKNSSSKDPIENFSQVDSSKRLTALWVHSLLYQRHHSWLKHIIIIDITVWIIPYMYMLCLFMHSIRRSTGHIFIPHEIILFSSDVIVQLLIVKCHRRWFSEPWCHLLTERIKHYTQKHVDILQTINRTNIEKPAWNGQWQMSFVV